MKYLSDDDKHALNCSSGSKMIMVRSKEDEKQQIVAGEEAKA